MAPDQPLLSLVVVVYNMRREAPRTLFTLTSAYQGIPEDCYEVIVVDNGSGSPLSAEDVKSFGKPFRYHYLSDASPSPAAALNHGARLARGRFLGFMIDGARMLTPGVLKYSIRASRAYDRPVVGTMGFHLGPKAQQYSVAEGYNQSVEDRLLESVDWRNHGYELFRISTFALSCRRGWFAPMAESNCVFLNRADFETLNGFDEAFDLPGGGLINLDFYRRALQLEGTEPVNLLGEGAFHQFHGGTTTDAVEVVQDAWDEMAAQYRKLRGEAFEVPQATCDYFGSVPPSMLPSLKQSVDDSPPAVED